jgi:hypothetical protein
LGAAAFAVSSSLLTRLGLMVPFAWLKFQLLLFIFPCWKGVVMVIVSTAPAASG